MGFPIYQTRPEDVVEHPAGRYQIGKGRRVSRLPLLDRQTGLFARVTETTTEAVAKRLGAREPTAEEMIELAHLSFWIRPVPIRETPEEKADRLKRGGTDPLERMATEDWAKRMDDAVLAELANWTGDKPVVNVGKAWVSKDLFGHIPPDHTVFNMGWDDDPDPAKVHWIQNVGWAHNAQHVDYSQVLWLIWDEDLPSDDPWVGADQTASIWESFEHGIVDPLRAAFDVYWKLFEAPESVPPEAAFDVAALEKIGGPGYRADRITMAPLSAIAESMTRSWPGGEFPKRESVLCVLAQNALETGFGKACHGWNLGNAKHIKGDGRGWSMFKCNEVLAGKVEWFSPPHPQTWFRAFDALDAGSKDYLDMLRERFDKSWPAIEAGDVETFGHALKVQRYYTADESAYVAGLKRIYDQIAKQVP